MIVIAMLTTIIAIPLIVLVLRLRDHIRAGASVREQLPGAATGSPFAAIMQWAKKHWFGILAVAAFLLTLAAIGAPSAAEKEILRSQFHLPPDVALAEIAVDRKKRAPFPADIEGVAQFSSAQFRDYLARLDDPDLWRPQPFRYDGVTFGGAYSPNALLWKDLQGARQLAWGHLSERRARMARSGRLLCFAVQHFDVQEAAPSLRGGACSEIDGKAPKTVYVQGLIDYEARTLHMLVRETRAMARRFF
jgi:hypothetical protein